MKTAKQTWVCIVAWFVAISVAALAHAEIIQGTASGPVAQVYWNQAGDLCLAKGDEFTASFVGQTTSEFLKDTKFTGLVNGQHDGQSDWSSDFGLHWPLDVVDWKGGSGTYTRRRAAGTSSVMFSLSQQALEWEWTLGGQPGCMVRVGPLTWTHETLYHDGDANKNGIFDSSDLIQVFAAGQYEDGIENNSTWETGDWTGDREFDSSDMVAAMLTGTYRSTAAIGVPEPSSLVLALLGFALMVSRSRFDS